MIVNGQAVAEEIYKEIGNDVRGKRVCFISFKKSPESEAFMKKKSLVAQKLGVETEIRELSATNTHEAVEYVRQISQEGFNGIVVQLPLPDTFEVQEVFDAVPRELDIDMLNTEAKDAYRENKTEREPPVAGAVHTIFDHYSVNPSGQKVVLLGKGRLVGEPVSLLLEREDIKFFDYDISTPQETITSALQTADIIITGIGKPHFLKPNMIKPGAVIIDAGTSEQNGVLAGDADPGCAKTASLFTPVPGGVGPITVAVLMRNLCYLC